MAHPPFLVGLADQVTPVRRARQTETEIRWWLIGTSTISVIECGIKSQQGSWIGTWNIDIFIRWNLLSKGIPLWRWWMIGWCAGIFLKCCIFYGYSKQIGNSGRRSAKWWHPDLLMRILKWKDARNMFLFRHGWKDWRSAVKPPVKPRDRTENIPEWEAVLSCCCGPQISF